MHYDIVYTLQVLPYLCYGGLILVFSILEIRNLKGQLIDGPTPEPGRGDFILPPGDGYEYFVSAGTIAYILKKAKTRYHVYVIQGREPATRLRHDRFGKYFVVREQDEAAVERVVDRVYRGAFEEEEG